VYVCVCICSEHALLWRREDVYVCVCMYMYVYVVNTLCYGEEKTCMYVYVCICMYM
jgi:hypothetical protein